MKTPIELPDHDSLRVLRVGTTQSGDLVVCKHNPGLIAATIATKAHRRAVREANERAFS